MRVSQPLAAWGKEGTVRGIRFRDALTAYLVGLAVAHLRLASIWSVTAARLHFWLTEDRGEMPTPLESYRTTETALKVYADSLSEDNDRLRHAVRIGVSGLIAEVVCEAGDRLHAVAASVTRTACNLARCAALAITTMWAATCAVGLIVLLVDGLIDTAAVPAVQGPPDAGVEQPVRQLDLCMAESPHYVLRWTHYERAPRLIVFAETRHYWWEKGVLLLVSPTQPFNALRDYGRAELDCGAEIFPRPETIAWSGGEFVADPLVITLD